MDGKCHGRCRDPEHIVTDEEKPEAGEIEHHPYRLRL
jgi:hypothetical protein